MSRTNRKSIFLALAALTLAHLVLIPIWDLASGGTPRLYVLDDNQAFTVFWPLVVTSWVIGTAGWVILERHHTKPSPAVSLAWLGFTLAATFSLTRIFLLSRFIRNFPGLSVSLTFKTGFMAAVLLLIILCFWYFGAAAFLRGSTTAALCFSPILPVLYIKAIRFKTSLPSRPAPEQGVDRAALHPIWIIIFDELDAKSVEREVSKGRLPEFARWKTFTLECTQAYPPAGATLYSIPAMLHGKDLTSDSVGLDYEFNLHTALADGTKRGWDWHDSLFNDVQMGHGRVTLIGWCFPYAPLYGNQIQDLHWVTQKIGPQRETGTNRLAEKYAGILLETGGPLFFFSLSLGQRSMNHADALRTIEALVRRQAHLSPSALVWVHYPVPHWPAVSGPQGSYLDNLSAADAALYNLRASLSEAGRWDDSTVLILGDHWFRKPADLADPFVKGSEDRWSSKDHRVPFLIKLPRQASGMTFSKACNTIALRELTKVLMDGKIQTYQDLAHWISLHGSQGESRFTEDFP